MDNLEQLTPTSKRTETWWKNQVDMIDKGFHDEMHFVHPTGISDYKRMKINYDLMNNILNKEDLLYVCQPYGEGMGELPARMTNRDVMSRKIKALLGKEMKSSFSWKALAVNPEATARKEQAEFGMMRDYVVSLIMGPIREQIEQKYAQTLQDPQLTDAQRSQITQSIAQEVEQRTPPEVKKYMLREHQDPAEVLAQGLLEYFIQHCDLKRKFNTCFKHQLLSAKGILYVGILNGEPQVWNINSMHLKNWPSTLSPFIEDSERIACEYYMSPSDIVRFFGDTLTKEEIRKIYEEGQTPHYGIVSDSMFTFDSYQTRPTGTRVLHTTWKALREVGFLELEDGSKIFVDRSYKLDPELQGREIEWIYLPEICEGWKIGTDIYKNMRPLPGQFKDVNNPYQAKHPYYGVVHDDMNSLPTSIADRLKQYQYYYNIIMYRVELLTASDKGKKILMNINNIPSSAGFNLQNWHYFFDSTPFMWIDPSEEGAIGNDLNSVARVLDMSLASDINRYIELARYIEDQMGKSVGVTDGIEGQIAPSESVTNARQNIVQSSNILEPIFDLHNLLKRNVLEALLEAAKVAYSGRNAFKLSYVLDDMSIKMLEVDIGLLKGSTYGIFMSNSAKAEEAKDMIRQLTHAAMQNDKITLSDVISVVRQEGIVEAEETLKVAEQQRQTDLANMEQNKIAALAQEEEKKRSFEKEKHQMELEKIKLKAEEDRETRLQVAALTGMSFNPDLDKDDDGINDFMEIAKFGVDAQIKEKKLTLESAKLAHKIKFDEEKLKIEKKKAAKAS